MRQTAQKGMKGFDTGDELFVVECDGRIRVRQRRVRTEKPKHPPRPAHRKSSMFERSPAASVTGRLLSSSSAEIYIGGFYGQGGETRGRTQEKVFILALGGSTSRGCTKSNVNE